MQKNYDDGTYEIYEIYQEFKISLNLHIKEIRKKLTKLEALESLEFSDCQTTDQELAMCKNDRIIMTQTKAIDLPKKIQATKILSHTSIDFFKISHKILRIQFV